MLEAFFSGGEGGMSLKGGDSRSTGGAINVTSHASGGGRYINYSEIAAILLLGIGGIYAMSLFFGKAKPRRKKGGK